MISIQHLLKIALCGLLICPTSLLAQKQYTLGNKFMRRTLLVSEQQTLTTQSIQNRQAHTRLTPENCEEFRLRVSEGTDKENTDRILKSSDFKVTDVAAYQNPKRSQSRGYRFTLQHDDMILYVTYELAKDESFCRKQIEIVPRKDFTLERIDVEVMDFDDAHQNYTIKEIYAQGPYHWKPGLGQPIYTTRTATYWGMEFPAATNEVVGHQIHCGYTPGVNLKTGVRYTSYPGVCGMADHPDFIDEAFYDYIDKIRIRPARLQIQYNSWFDFAQSVSSQKFIESLKTVHHELVEKRGCKPLSAYVIDDGWQDASKTANWSDTVWKVNSKFQPDFKECFSAVNDAQSRLGLWLSPASILGAASMVPKMGEYGFESLGMGMSLTGPVYMRKLEDRITELARMGVAYFKFDGLFGHLNIRDFETRGRGTAAMPQLGVQGLKGNEETLNDHRYDELKEYYLCAGTERMMEIFKQLSTINPDIFIAITNGAYLSPWWMQYVDVVWLINAGDAAAGNSRTQELVYRDHIYYQIWEQEHTKFPMNSIFNHEPKKISANETPQSFRDYLYMNLSRGTGFIELYIRTKRLSSSDWDIVAEGLQWAYKMSPVFKHVRMHGGNPSRNEVYGYTAWEKNQGYISFHNPSDKAQAYSFSLDRTNGVPKQLAHKLHVSSPNGKSAHGIPDKIKYGDCIHITLQPHEILLLDFE